jgi:hypothetical protein
MWPCCCQLVCHLLAGRISIACARCLMVLLGAAAMPLPPLLPLLLPHMTMLL